MSMIKVQNDEFIKVYTAYKTQNMKELTSFSFGVSLLGFYVIYNKYDFSLALKYGTFYLVFLLVLGVFIVVLTDEYKKILEKFVIKSIKLNEPTNRETIAAIEAKYTIFNMEE